MVQDRCDETQIRSDKTEAEEFFGKARSYFMNRSSNEKDCCKHIKGIQCDVKNCVYHDGETYCTAGQIAVGPSYATSSADTVCATFEQKEI